ncbi:hypothetical protein [Clostridiisalibacter paucivorans]|nr:hypothetical protein [Clostridiisalibacter paucivorans]
MYYDVFLIVIILIILISVQYTLNKILVELKKIRGLLSNIKYKE